MFPFNKKGLIYEQSAIGHEQLYITETIADATVATQAGFPSISFDASLMKEEILKDLITIATKSKTIFILNTTNDPKRVAWIGKVLALQGLSVFVLKLPGAPGSGGVAAFLKANNSAAFRKLADAAPSFLSALIGQLPQDFEKAYPIIKGTISSFLSKLDSAARSHYIEILSKQVKTKRRVIEEMLEEQKKAESTSSEAEEEEIDPEVQAEAEALALDPQLLKMRIDAVNEAGVVGERKNIAVFFAALDSRLIRETGVPGQSVLAVKCAGHYGGGKSFTLLTCLALYPEKAYHLITSGSERSLYYLPESLQHKCLIVTEGFQFTGDRGDSQIAYALRSLLSEGRIIHWVTEKNDDGKMVTTKKVIEGPTSFITTTVVEALEPQLEDRMFTIHPDESMAQTKKILQKTAEMKSGVEGLPDVSGSKKWKALHRLLEPVLVVIPFAPKIFAHLQNMDPLPLATRRAFNKVLNVIQATACLYQLQRTRDASDRVVAEIADYHMALQVVAEAFAENLGKNSQVTDTRLKFIEEKQHISLGALASHFGVSKSTLSAWAKRMEGEGLVDWVDDQGNDFPDDNALKKAKRSGRAHLQASPQTSQGSHMGLPATADLAPDDPTWQKGGKDFETFDLKLTPPAPALVSAGVPPVAAVSQATPAQNATPPVSTAPKARAAWSPFGKPKQAEQPTKEPAPEAPPSADPEDPDGNPFI